MLISEKFSTERTSLPSSKRSRSIVESIRVDPAKMSYSHQPWGFSVSAFKGISPIYWTALTRPPLAHRVHYQSLVPLPFHFVRPEWQDFFLTYIPSKKGPASKTWFNSANLSKSPVLNTMFRISYSDQTEWFNSWFVLQINMKKIYIPVPKVDFRSTRLHAKTGLCAILHTGSRKIFLQSHWTNSSWSRYWWLVNVLGRCLERLLEGAVYERPRKNS